MSDANEPLSISAADRRRTHRISHEAMACTWEIHILGDDPTYAEHAARAAFDEIDRLELELSRFVEHSDISRINALRAGESACIGIDAFDCLRMASELHTETNGAFDVSIGALLEDAADTTSPFGMSHLALDAKSRNVTVDIDGLIIDLGGLAKGYAVDQAVEILREWSIEAALIHSGQSTVYALGSPPGQPGWTIAIRDPSDHAKTLARVCLRNRALSGSGTALHGPHIIDPRTGAPAACPLASWAVASSAAISDALSTTFSVFTADEVEAYCRKHTDVLGAHATATPDGTVLNWLETGSTAE
ncbi:MAG: FAD:protein FMN transferase [Planctomycetes bacterium]|nr:FAD:protein FMN transferase [Planctomycetota bacterium]